MACTGLGGDSCGFLTMWMKDGDHGNGDMVKSAEQMTSVGGDGDGGSGWIDIRVNERSSRWRRYRSRGLCLCPGLGQRLRTLGPWIGWVAGRTRPVDDAGNVCLDLEQACQLVLALSVWFRPTIARVVLISGRGGALKSTHILIGPPWPWCVRPWGWPCTAVAVWLWRRSCAWRRWVICRIVGLWSRIQIGRRAWRRGKVVATGVIVVCWMRAVRRNWRRRRVGLWVIVLLVRIVVGIVISCGCLLV